MKKILFIGLLYISFNIFCASSEDAFKPLSEEQKKDLADTLEVPFISEKDDAFYYDELKDLSDSFYGEHFVGAKELFVTITLFKGTPQEIVYFFETENLDKGREAQSKLKKFKSKKVALEYLDQKVSNRLAIKMSIADARDKADELRAAEESRKDIKNLTESVWGR